MDDLRDELTAMLYRAEAAGSQVVSITGVRQLLRQQLLDEEAEARQVCCAGCAAGTMCDQADDEQRAKAWRWTA